MMRSCYLLWRVVKMVKSKSKKREGREREGGNGENPD
jgi:hypothetical protein